MAKYDKMPLPIRETGDKFSVWKFMTGKKIDIDENG